MTEHRFHYIAKVTKLRGSHAVRLTYHTGATETVSIDYLVGLPTGSVTARPERSGSIWRPRSSGAVLDAPAGFVRP